ncbi:dephospho-CoA kinase [Helicobacter muridarum]|uniref:Dephospho-CoA kinase n=1 Tax=Helicobacter muridarum TaxID=216 RepID=A0A099TVF6_9HELI|nr:dephospho-CoA kinase [Helicobacter muridarum]TLD99023.1 dephospho-CoA kinase [Helicobacter muridarum]STQ85410.1 Dephospho-CoA kinase [Helicobacter muridarum]
MQYANILTGGIGCGKSTVAKLLELHGFQIIDADIISREAMNEKKDCIIQSFGDEIIESNEKSDEIIINRTKLGQIIFNDKNKKTLLEDILHPLIQSKILYQCNKIESKKVPYFVEIPLYFESRFEYKARYVICVYTTRENQIQRVQQRNNLCLEEAIKRVDSQIDIEIKKKKSDFIIENLSDLKSLQKNIESFLQSFLPLFS